MEIVTERRVVVARAPRTGELVEVETEVQVYPYCPEMLDHLAMAPGSLGGKVRKIGRRAVSRAIRDHIRSSLNRGGAYTYMSSLSYEHRLRNS